VYAVPCRDLLAVVFLVVRVYAVSCRALLHCCWGDGRFDMHAVPDWKLLGIFGSYSVCGLPSGELLDCSWGFELFCVHAVPCRDLLSNHGGGFQLHSLPGGGSVPGRRRGDVCGGELERGG
jgi:hypothetical protein